MSDAPSNLAPDVAAMVAFVRTLPELPWYTGTAFIPDRARETIFSLTFTKDEAESVSERFAKANREGYNVYLHVNTMREKMSGRGVKPSKVHVRLVYAIHGDVDPREGQPIEAERARLIAEFADAEAMKARGLPAPTTVVMSGSGVQAYWYLAQPVPLAPDDADAATKKAKAVDFERYTRGVESALGDADDTHDVSRMFRWAGTINHPDAKKRAKGRVPALSYLVAHHPERVYAPADFPFAPPKGAATPSPKIAEEPDAEPDSGATLADLPTEELRRVAEHGRDTEDVTRFRKRNGTLDRSRAVHWFLCECHRRGVTQAKALGIVTGAAFGIAASVRDKPSPIDEARKQWRKSLAANAKTNPNSVNANRPDGRALARLVHTSYGVPLIHHQDEFFEYHSGIYRPVEDGAIRKAVYDTVEAAGGEINSRGVSDAMDGLEALCLIRRDRFEPPCWLDERDVPNPRELVVCSNGLLHVPTRALSPHNSAFLAFNALPYGYDPAAKCPRWRTFLSEVFPDEPDAVLALQEFAGYVLTSDTSIHKIFLFVGPPRSGKGTINRVTTALVGKANVASPKLSQLGDTFGRQCLIGKRLALIGDMRIGKHTDVVAVAEMLNGISGDDEQTIPRKHRDDWIGKLETRFAIFSNEPPSITDTSGALASRFVVLQMNQSFFGRENPNLTEELLAELPGVLNWAMEGLERLKAQGRFTEVKSSAELMDHIKRAQSPIGSFIADKCSFEPHPAEANLYANGEPLFAEKDGLYVAYREWCGHEDVPHTSKELFCKGFIAATLGRVKPGRRRLVKNGPQEPGFFGVRLLNPIPDYREHLA